MKIGIDPSLNGCTLICLNDNSDKILDYLYLDTNTKHNLMDRILLLQFYTLSFLERNKAEKVNIETPYFNRFNPKAFFVQSRLYQQLIYLCYTLNIKVNEYEPKTIKKNLGKGNLNKKEVYLAIEGLYPKIFGEITNLKLNKLELEGLCDAFAIAIM